MPASFLFLSGGEDATFATSAARRLSPFARSELRAVRVANGVFFHADMSGRPDGEFLLLRPAPGSDTYLAGLAAPGFPARGASLEPTAPLSELVPRFRCAVLFEPERQRFTLARDATGLRNLYYALHPVSGVTLAVSNQLRWLLHALPPASFTLDRSSVAQLLCMGFTIDPATMVREVASLPTGCRVAFPEQAERAPAFAADVAPGPPELRDATRARSQVREALVAATEDALRGSSSPACLLSGGVDSSCVASIAQRILGVPISTYSLVFTDDSLSEARYASAVAARLGTRHHNVELTQVSFEQGLDAALASLDQPTSDALNTWFISRAIAGGGSDVGITGVGSDELFGGHDCNQTVPQGLRVLRYLRRMPGLARSTAARLFEILACGGDHSRPSQALRGKIVALLQQPCELGAVYLLSRFILLPRAVARLLPSEPAQEIGRLPEAMRLRLAELEAGADGIFRRIAAYEQQLYLCDQLVRDLAMVGDSTGLDLRLPFRDPRVIGAVARVAEETLYLPGRPKRFLIEAFSDVLPSEAYQRPKMGFVMPVHQWLGGAIQDRMERLLAMPELVACAGLDVRAARELIADCRRARGRIFYTREWVLFVLLEWIRQNRSAFASPPT